MVAWARQLLKCGDVRPLGGSGREPTGAFGPVAAPNLWVAIRLSPAITNAFRCS